MATRDLIDVFDPASVRLDGVGRQTDQLDTTLVEFRFELCESTELGGADGGVVLRVGEQHNPVVTDELMEVDGTGGGLGLEVRRDGSQAEAAKVKVKVLVNRTLSGSDGR